MQGTVPVDGLPIFYDVRGAGPPLLLLAGGLGDAEATVQLADALAGTRTVISYDRRGLSRSPAPDDVPVTVERHAADAAALLAELAGGPADVVGASIGALIALHLAVAAPDRVRTVVAHEPPMQHLLPDPEAMAALDRVGELARTDPGAAGRLMAERTGAGDPTEPGAAPGPPAGDLLANVRRFFAHDFPAVRAATLEPSRIAEVAGDRVVPAGGADSRGRWEYRCAERLAAALGRDLVELPGGHNGMVGRPWATAAALPALLDR